MWPEYGTSLWQSMIRGEGSCSSLELGAEALGMNCRGPQDQTLDLDAIIKAPKQKMQKLQVFLLALEVLAVRCLGSPVETEALPISALLKLCTK